MRGIELDVDILRIAAKTGFDLRYEISSVGLIIPLNLKSLIYKILNPSSIKYLLYSNLNSNSNIYFSIMPTVYICPPSLSFWDCAFTA